jgi:hypothetical protein
MVFGSVGAFSGHVVGVGVWLDMLFLIGYRPIHIGDLGAVASTMHTSKVLDNLYLGCASVICA